MGHYNFGDLVAWANGVQYCDQMIGVIRARVNHSYVGAAQQIGIGAGKGHGRGVWGQYSTY
jgi:hypothetical protein